MKPKYDRFQELQAAIQDSQAKLTIATDQLTSYQTTQATTQTTQQALQSKQADEAILKDRIPVLTKQRQSFQKAADLKQAVVTGEDHLAGIKQQLVITNKSVTDLQEQTNQIETDLTQRDQLKDQDYRLKQAKAQLVSYQQQLNHLYRQMTDNHTLESQIKAAESALATAKTQVKVTQANYDELRNNWLKSQIMNLVGQLKDGTPCPVCGSLEHPAPAHVEDIQLFPTCNSKPRKITCKLLKMKQLSKRL